MENLKGYLEYNKENEKYTVAVGMSGGVDSSVVAYLLKKQGYNVIGITMKHWSGFNEEKTAENTKTCCTIDDLYDAKRVCDDLGIPHYVVNLEQEFKQIVVDKFIEEYSNGRTPNPCMICNRNIKMGKLIEQALKMGADFIATGHYAKIVDGKLSMGDDLRKDQVYFLSQVREEFLKYLMFPVGDLEKTQVRELGKELGVRVFAKKDSQEVCFVEDGKLKEFLIDMTDGKISKSGNIVTTDGTILGQHQGIGFYTIGQRKGLGISYPTPLYIIKIDARKNEIIVGSNEELFKDSLVATDINLMGFNSIEELDGFECKAKTRSRDTLHPCKVKVLNDGFIKVIFTEDKVRAITPGQGLVLYSEKGEVLASGFIK